jgi:hypothetical protein
VYLELLSAVRAAKLLLTNDMALTMYLIPQRLSVDHLSSFGRFFYRLMILTVLAMTSYDEGIVGAFYFIPSL